MRFKPVMTVFAGLALIGGLKLARKKGRANARPFFFSQVP